MREVTNKDEIAKIMHSERNRAALMAYREQNPGKEFPDRLVIIVEPDVFITIE